MCKTHFTLFSDSVFCLCHMWSHFALSCRAYIGTCRVWLCSTDQFTHPSRVGVWWKDSEPVSGLAIFSDQNQNQIYKQVAGCFAFTVFSVLSCGKSLYQKKKRKVQGISETLQMHWFPSSVTDGSNPWLASFGEWKRSFFGSRSEGRVPYFHLLSLRDKYRIRGKLAEGDTVCSCSCFFLPFSSSMCKEPNINF